LSITLFVHLSSYLPNCQAVLTAVKLLAGLSLTFNERGEEGGEKDKEAHDCRPLLSVCRLELTSLSPCGPLISRFFGQISLKTPPPLKKLDLDAMILKIFGAKNNLVALVCKLLRLIKKQNETEIM
jgi:hypothetical protein